MKRLGKARSRFEKTKAALSEHDRAELEIFEQFLRDKATMTVEELYQKHADYLGLPRDFTIQQGNDTMGIDRRILLHHLAECAIGEMSCSKLAQDLGKHPPAVTSMCKTMANEGLVSAWRHRGDVWKVKITDKGRAY